MSALLNKGCRSWAYNVTRGEAKVTADETETIERLAATLTTRERADRLLLAWVEHGGYISRVPSSAVRDMFADMTAHGATKAEATKVIGLHPSSLGHVLRDEVRRVNLSTYELARGAYEEWRFERGIFDD